MNPRTIFRFLRVFLQPLRTPDLAFNAPLTMIALTYFLMHVMSLALREGLRYRARSEAAPLVRRLSLAEWSLKVLPVAAASGLEVRVDSPIKHKNTTHPILLYYNITWEFLLVKQRQPKNIECRRAT